MKRLKVATVFLMVPGLVGTMRSDDKPNPTGVWKWIVSIGGQERVQVLELRVEGKKLTGFLFESNYQETIIEDGKYEDGEISFQVTRDRNGQKITTKYVGKVNGDTIKGKMKSDREDQNQGREWDAKRAKHSFDFAHPRFPCVPED